MNWNPGDPKQAATSRPQPATGRSEGPTQTASTAGDGVVGTPSISLPRGGGTIRGIGEKFATNPVTGTGSTNPTALSADSATW